MLSPRLERASGGYQCHPAYLPRVLEAGYLSVCDDRVIALLSLLSPF